MNHNILLENLFSGIRGLALDILKSFLLNGNQYVPFPNSQSDRLAISSGVLQGSILGAFSFILCINDIVNVTLNGGVKLIIYADDTNIFASHEYGTASTATMKEVLRKITAWTLSNK